MAGDDINAHCDAIAKLRALGVLRFKCAEFEVELGYPFGEPSRGVAMREGGLVTPAQPQEHAADLVLNPPDLSKVTED
jgi:hypothetical protein